MALRHCLRIFCLTIVYTLNREYQKDYILKLNKQAIELTQFFVKLFVYLKKRKTILHVHEYGLWVVVVFFLSTFYTISLGMKEDINRNLT